MANVIKGVTVNQLAKKLNQLVKDGYGDKQVMFPVDDEINDYQVVWGTCHKVSGNFVKIHW